MTQLVAPFPYFGGKREVARMVWERLGDVPNYVEPFFGSGAVLLGRPTPPQTETCNDLDGLLCNFWRAVAAAPDEVAAHADWPVSECDLSSRHLWLVERRGVLTQRLAADPEWFDVQAAGWWVWGACAWIGGGWCSGDGPWVRDGDTLVKRDQGRGINRQMPHLGDQGRGINRKMPHLGDQGRGIAEWFGRLSDRLRRVRVACGPWDRVLGDSVTWRHGVTGVFLDPPYTSGKSAYAAGGEGGDLARAVAEWARVAGRRDDMRVALCGHLSEHDMPGWECVQWTAPGGYGNQGGDDEDDNRHRECIWFSPACLGGGGQLGLFR